MFTHKQQHPTSPKLYFIQNKTFKLTLMFGFKFSRNIKLPEQTSICICMHLHSLPFCYYGFSSFHTFKFHVRSILLKDFPPRKLANCIAHLNVSMRGKKDKTIFSPLENKTGKLLGNLQQSLLFLIVNFLSCLQNVARKTHTILKQ